MLSGRISTGTFLGSFEPTHGDVLTSRSRSADLKITATMPGTTWTVAGERQWVMAVTQAWISLGRTDASRRSPKRG
ncbi:MAG: hypothetical protein ACRDRH_27320 [Pseudonocardia sp.]